MEDYKSKIKTNEFGINYAEVTDEDCLNWGGIAVCDMCNNRFKKGRLVFLLDRCLCEKCGQEYLDKKLGLTDEELKQDLKLQEEKSDGWYKYHLDRDGIQTCSICGQMFFGFGNNAAPVNNGRCCDDCNEKVVIPTRIMYAVKDRD